MPPEDTVTPGVTTETPPTAGTTPDGEPQEDGSTTKETKTEDIKSLPEWAQKKIGALNAEARQNRLDKQKALDDKKASEEATLKEQNNYKALYEKAEKELSELKPKAAQTEELNELLMSRINAEIADWPEEVKSMAPDGEVSAAEMVKWLEKAKPLALKVMKGAETTTQERSVKPGNLSGPKPTEKGRQENRLANGNNEPVIDAAKRF